MSKMITMLASGTRGDVQPYVALGRGLQAAGYEVRVATHLEFRAVVEGHGLEFARLEGNLSQVMIRPNGQMALTFDGNLLRSLRAALDFMRAARPVYERLLATAWQACQNSGAIVIGLPTVWGAPIAEALGVPCLWAFLQPFSRTRAFPSALLPSAITLGSLYNRLTYFVIEQALWHPWRTVINHWRRETLYVRSAPFLGPYHDLAGAPILYGFSSQVIPRPTDWPPMHVIAGYWFLDDPPDWQAPAELRRFLDAGPRPVYVGFGSMGVQDPARALAVIDRALAACDLRAVLALPDDFDVRAPPQSRRFVIRDVPHSWLFPQMSAVMHHGGAGTIAAGLRAGVPALITPLAVDQFFWGKRLAELGVGPRPIPQRDLNVEKLTQALQQATQDETMRARAQVLGQAIRAEDGVQQAVKLIQARV